MARQRRAAADVSGYLGQENAREKKKERKEKREKGKEEKK